MKKDIVKIGIFYLGAGLVIGWGAPWCIEYQTAPNEWSTICIGAIIGFVLSLFVGLPLLIYGLISK